ncbi:hypothetical protein TUMEXPCC7403_23030 [Tumidithrix helvetica PCC 7403]|uniref:hypothetical protein n=1 Tax=Tumidithrix helvetica TaxID=3457545 RepID=UPI003CADBDA2
MSQSKNNNSESESVSETVAELETNQWFICKQTSGICTISNDRNAKAEAGESWGPFATQGEAIAKRIGLIRAGKCQPL